MKTTKEKPDHPKLAAWLKAYRAKGNDAEITKTGALWPNKAAKAWTAHLKAGK